MFFKVFCDTSFFYASLTPEDPNYDRARRALQGHPQVGLMTSWEIVSETVTLLRYRQDYPLAVRFLAEVKPHLEIVPCDEHMREEAVHVFKRFSKDKKLSFCDCLSFVILTSLKKGLPVFTFDRDFKQFGFQVPC